MSGSVLSVLPALRRGSRVELDDMHDDYTVELYKTRFYAQPYWREPKPKRYVIVDYVVQTGAMDYYVVPQCPYTYEYLLYHDLLIDAKDIVRVSRINTKKNAALIIVNEQPKLANVQPIKGWQIAQTHTRISGALIRPNHQYLPLGQLSGYVALILQQRQPGKWFNITSLDYVVRNSPNTHLWARALELQIKGQDLEQELTQLWVQIDLKRLKKWLKQQGPRFYESVERFHRQASYTELANQEEIAQLLQQEQDDYEQRTAMHADAVELDLQDQIEQEELDHVDAQQLYSDHEHLW